MLQWICIINEFAKWSSEFVHSLKIFGNAWNQLCLCYYKQIYVEFRLKISFYVCGCIKLTLLSKSWHCKGIYLNGCPLYGDADLNYLPLANRPRTGDYKMPSVRSSVRSPCFYRKLPMALLSDNIYGYKNMPNINFGLILKKQDSCHRCFWLVLLFFPHPLTTAVF